MEIREDRLNELLGKIVNELYAAVTGLHVSIGDKLGLYKRLGYAGEACERGENVACSATPSSPRFRASDLH